MELTAADLEDGKRYEAWRHRKLMLSGTVVRHYPADNMGHVVVFHDVTYASGRTTSSQTIASNYGHLHEPIETEFRGPLS